MSTLITRLANNGTFFTNGNGVFDEVTNQGSSPPERYTTAGYLVSGILDEVTYNSTAPVIKNLLSYTEQFDNAAWGKSNTTITPNTSATTAPDGTLTADKLIENTTNSNHFVVQNVGTISGSYTISCFLKSAERYKGYIQLFGSGGNAAAFFDLNLGTTGGAGNTITAYPNGWYRITSTFTFTSATAAVYIVLNDNSGTASYTGDGVSGIYVWGAQVEVGSAATIYQGIAAANTLVSPGFVKRVSNDSTSYVTNIFDEVTGGAVVDSSLVLWLDAFNASSYPGTGTTWTDLSGNGNNGTLTNGPTYSSANGGSIVLDGTNDYVITPSNNLFYTTNSITFNMWFNAANTTQLNACALNFQKSGWQGYQFYQSGTGMVVVYSGQTGSNDFSASCTIAANTWYMLTFVINRTAGFYYVYQNAVQRASSAITHPAISTGSAVLSLGNRSVVPDSYWSGSIANFQVYNKALTAAEILQNFNALRDRYGI